MRQAKVIGLSRAVLSYRCRAGTLERVGRGVYRIPSADKSDRGYIIENYLRLDWANPTVTHRSALELLGILDPAGPPVHITVERRYRSLSFPASTRLHTRSQPWSRAERTQIFGLRVTRPVEAILDAVSDGISSEQLAPAIKRAIELGLVDGSRLGLRAFDSLGFADTTRIWDNLPPPNLNACIADVFGRIAKRWRVGAVLLDPEKHSRIFDPAWQLVVIVGTEMQADARWELHDLFVHDLEWPLSKHPTVTVDFVDERTWIGSSLPERIRSGRRLA